MLYRGINKVEDEANGGRLVPKGNSVAVAPMRDGKCKRDGTFKRIPCESNTARAHQIESGLYEGCGISTSRSEDVAIYFATSGHTEDGYVYVIDETMLTNANVEAHEFDTPVHPHEREVTLIEKSGSALPDTLIVQKYAVNSEGKRT